MPKQKILRNYTPVERLENLNRQLESVDRSNADYQRQITALHHRVAVRQSNLIKPDSMPSSR